MQNRRKGNHQFLPQTAQVAGQQGAYAARLLDRNYDLSTTPPTLKTEATWLKAWLQLRGLDAAPGFDFLNLGLLAYVGDGQALTEVQLGEFCVEQRRTVSDCYFAAFGSSHHVF